MRDIFITGCARSGTTLLNRLFYAFADFDVIDHEVTLIQFLQWSGVEKANMCGKRAVNTIFSNNIPAQEVQVQAAMLSQYDVTVINIIRDGRDVCHVPKKGTIATPVRWMESLCQAETYPDLITCNVYYEDIVTKPDRVQEALANLLGLEPEYRWSDYPDFVPDKGFGSASVQGLQNYGKRKIKPSKHDPDEWRKHLAPQHHKLFENYLQKFDNKDFEKSLRLP